MSSGPPSERGIFRARVAGCRRLCRDHFELSLAAESFPHAEPGHFVQVLCSQPHDSSECSGAIADGASVGLGRPMLRRPFSIAGLRRHGSCATIEILGRVVGPGTAWLAALSIGDDVELLGPLGRPFVIPSGISHALLVAGGVGLPPIRWLAEVLRTQGVNCSSFLGAQTQALLPVRLIEEPASDGGLSPCVEEFARIGVASAITTDDGTCGLPGRVTEAVQRFLGDRGDEKRVQVYACGPEPMLRALAAICRERHVACQVAMERVMGCGMGTCQSCVVRVQDETLERGWRYALCCTDGPVFDAHRVIW